MGFAQRRITGVLLAVEAIYACATIGLMAIDLFTTTGARMNEVMQIRLTEDCIVRLKNFYRGKALAGSRSHPRALLKPVMQ
jgi:hypothetical protein